MLKRLLLDDSAAMLAEYALILAIVTGGMACAAFYLGDTISSAMVRASELLSEEWATVKAGK